MVRAWQNAPSVYSPIIPYIHSPAALNDDVDCRTHDDSAKTTRPIDISFTRLCREIQDEQIRSVYFYDDPELQ